MTRIIRTLASTVTVVIDNTSQRRSDVLVQVLRRSRGGAVLTFNEGDAVITLSEAERIALIEALGGTR
jgi:hypothetical protein